MNRTPFTFQSKHRNIQLTEVCCRRRQINESSDQSVPRDAMAVASLTTTAKTKTEKLASTISSISFSFKSPHVHSTSHASQTRCGTPGDC